MGGGGGGMSFLGFLEGHRLMNQVEEAQKTQEGPESCSRIPKRRARRRRRRCAAC